MLIRFLVREGVNSKAFSLYINSISSAISADWKINVISKMKLHGILATLGVQKIFEMPCFCFSHKDHSIHQCWLFRRQFKSLFTTSLACRLDFEALLLQVIYEVFNDQPVNISIQVLCPYISSSCNRPHTRFWGIFILIPVYMFMFWLFSLEDLVALVSFSSQSCLPPDGFVARLTLLFLSPHRRILVKGFVTNTFPIRKKMVTGLCN